MADNCGLVKFKDGTIMHFEWNGSVDVCMPRLYNTYEELVKNWRIYFDVPDDCSHNEEEIIIFNGYSYWVGKACRKCGYITDKTSYERLENLEDQIFGIPDWVKEYKNNTNL